MEESETGEVGASVVGAVEATSLRGGVTVLFVRESMDVSEVLRGGVEGED